MLPPLQPGHLTVSQSSWWKHYVQGGDLIQLPEALLATLYPSENFSLFPAVQKCRRNRKVYLPVVARVSLSDPLENDRTGRHTVQWRRLRGTRICSLLGVTFDPQPLHLKVVSTLLKAFLALRDHTVSKG